MLQKVNIVNGFGQIKGAGRYVKVISSLTPVRVEALNDGAREVLSTLLRAPMATAFPEQSATINFYADTDQQLEVWYGQLPLEYLQLTAVGATRMNIATKLVYPGVTELLPATPRKSVKLKAGANLLIGENAAGWPLDAGIVQEFETIGAVSCYIEKPPFDVGLIGDTVAVASALAVANPHQIERFNGKTYAALQTGALVTITDAGVITDITGSTGLIKIGMIKAFNGVLYVAGTVATGVALMKSVNGSAFSKVAETLDGTAMTSTPYKTNFYRGIISASFYNSHYVVCDLTKGTIETRALRNANTSRDYMSNGVNDFEVSNQGVWHRLASQPLAAFELIAAGDWRNAALSENSGLPLAISTANSKVSQIAPDGTVTQISASNASSGVFASSYFNAGVDAWHTGTTMLFFVDGAEFTKTVSISQIGVGTPRYDADAGAVHWISSGASNNAVNKLPLGQQVVIDPVLVNVLEFII